MSTISLLKTVTGEAVMTELPLERSRAQSAISLLAFLQAENLKLRNAVAQLKRDTTALREVLRDD
jgi:hypothetical protein